MLEISDTLDGLVNLLIYWPGNLSGRSGLLVNMVSLEGARLDKPPIRNPAFTPTKTERIVRFRA
jgi:hypothetical protein